MTLEHPSLYSMPLAHLPARYMHRDVFAHGKIFNSRSQICYCLKMLRSLPAKEGIYLLILYTFVSY